MKLIFDWPKKLIIEECSLKFETITINDMTIVCFKNKNVFYSSKLEKITYTRCTYNSYFINIFEDYYGFVRTAISNEDLTESLERLDKQQIEEYISKWIYNIQNIDKVNQEKEIQVLEKLKENEEKVRQDAIKEEQFKQAQAKELEEAQVDFLSGKYISPVLFEKLCKQNDIIIPIKTLGAIRKHITSISTENVMCYKKVNSVWDYIKALKETIEMKEDIVAFDAATTRNEAAYSLEEWNEIERLFKRN
jgi:hypothetical protein